MAEALNIFQYLQCPVLGNDLVVLRIKCFAGIFAAGLSAVLGQNVAYPAEGAKITALRADHQVILGGLRTLVEGVDSVIQAVAGSRRLGYLV